jgi:hypothetical protein
MLGGNQTTGNSFHRPDVSSEDGLWGKIDRMDRVICTRSHGGSEVDQMMAKDETRKKKMSSPASSRSRTTTPDWSKGLRQLYDSVVDEPLPDTFSDLLSKLDSGSK